MDITQLTNVLINIQVIRDIPVQEMLLLMVICLLYLVLIECTISVQFNTSLGFVQEMLLLIVICLLYYYEKSVLQVYRILQVDTCTRDVITKGNMSLVLLST